MQQMIMDGVEILLNIASESSGIFAPLKPAPGGMNMLIKHCEVFV